MVRVIGSDDASAQAYALDIFYSGSAVFTCAGCGEEIHIAWDPAEYGDMPTWEAVTRTIYGEPPRCTECRHG